MSFKSKLEIQEEYFEWMYDLACRDRYSEQISYRHLLRALHDINFYYIIPRDKNRAGDGIDLRYRFSCRRGYEQDGIDIYRYLNAPCSVLEMILALAIRCEETIMADPDIGDRTQQWFWGMIGNLGLGAMTDERFDRHVVDQTISRFLDREYEPNGKGGLFTVKNCGVDLRNVEIWYQMNWYLKRIT